MVNDAGTLLTDITHSEESVDGSFLLDWLAPLNVVWRLYTTGEPLLLERSNQAGLTSRCSELTPLSEGRVLS